ncbi:hypothetical protein CPB85DRAFT_1312094 [Mucidula mucida]|nr:hypothetical protein CPB85DRAFT_1312094 [Mucidula mucida]
MDESLSQDHTSPQATESSLIAKVLNVVVLLLFDIAMLTFGVLLVNDCPLHLTVATTPAAFAVLVQCLILVLATCSKWPPLLLYGLHMICFCGLPWFFPCDTRHAWNVVVILMVSSLVFYGAIRMHPGGLRSMGHWVAGFESLLQDLGSTISDIVLSLRLMVAIVVQSLGHVLYGPDNESPGLSVPEDEAQVLSDSDNPPPVSHFLF